MKARWKQYEMILVSVAFAGFLLVYFWHHLGPQRAVTNTADAKEFIHNHADFNLFRNLILPQVGWVALCYLAYVVINRFVIPALWQKTLLKKIPWMIFFWLLLSAVCSFAFTLSVYLIEEWRYEYPGFSAFYIGHNSHEGINLAGIIAGSLFGTGVFFTYAALREIIIAYIERPGAQRHYRIMIANQLAVFIGSYLVFILLAQFLLGLPFRHFIRLLSLPLLSIFLGFANIYYYFPKNEGRSLFSRWLLVRLLLLSIILTLPATLLISGSGEFVFPLSMVFQLLVVTPISWVLYRQQKDHILAFRGMEKDLSRSTADLQALRLQINPHFLFNAFNTIYSSAIAENAERTAQSLQMMSEMMRFMLDENNSDFILLRQEIGYLQNFIALQKMRLPLSENMIVEFNIGKYFPDRQIAPMLLIPLVENAFKHGISFHEPSWIKIEVLIKQDQLSLKIVNSLHPRKGLDDDNSTSGIGLNNVRQRLKLIYPGRYSLKATQDGREFITLLHIDLSSNLEKE